MMEASPSVTVAKKRGPLSPQCPVKESSNSMGGTGQQHISPPSSPEVQGLDSRQVQPRGQGLFPRSHSGQ